MLTLSKSEQDAKYSKLMEQRRWRGPNLPAVMFISAWDSMSSDHNYNTQRHLQLRDVLEEHRYSFKPVLGCWEEVQEASYCVVLPSEITLQEAAIAELKRIAFDRFDQAAVLIADRYRMCTLHWDGGDVTEAGQLVPATFEEAHAAGDYTYDPQQDQYYITR